MFKRFVIITILFLAIMYAENKIFDSMWEKGASIPLNDLKEVYKPPKQYDNYKRINVKLVEDNKFGIESNKRFKVAGTDKGYDYYDTLDIKFPVENFNFLNKIFLNFEGSNELDSIYFVVSKSQQKNLYWKQIFLSTVIIEILNDFSDDPLKFRVNVNELVDQQILENNDTLINKALDYFNNNKDKIRLGDCGVNSKTFFDICSMFDLPCRQVGLMGGDADQSGFNDIIGYPTHAVCEVYSSKHRKWYVIDPSYGSRFRNSESDDYLNAVEINNMVLFQREKFIVKDSILSTMHSSLDRDYFKYYQNIYFKPGFVVIRPLRIFLKFFYSKFAYIYYHYTNNLNLSKNGLFYVTVKSFIFLIICLLYINSILLVMTRRLFTAKKPKKVTDHD